MQACLFPLHLNLFEGFTNRGRISRKMHLLQALCSSALLLPVLASASGTCTKSSSLSWPPVGDCATPGKFDTLVQNCRACCMNDAPCFQTCLKAGGLSRRSASGEISLGVIPELRGQGKRAVDLTCAVNEGCYKFTDGSLLCLSLGTGMYGLRDLVWCSRQQRRLANASSYRAVS